MTFVAGKAKAKAKPMPKRAAQAAPSTNSRHQLGPPQMVRENYGSSMAEEFLEAGGAVAAICG